MAATRSRKPASSSKKSSLTAGWLYVLCMLAFLASSIFQKMEIELANYIFALIGLLLFVMAVRKYFRK
jgi:Mg/Co/Ni transporter MgtE